MTEPDFSGDGQLLLAELQRLPARQRSAVVLALYLDLPEAEVGAPALGAPQGTVKILAPIGGWPGCGPASAPSTATMRCHVAGRHPNDDREVGGDDAHRGGRHRAQLCHAPFEQVVLRRRRQRSLRAAVVATALLLDGGGRGRRSSWPWHRSQPCRPRRRCRGLEAVQSPAYNLQVLGAQVAGILGGSAGEVVRDRPASSTSSLAPRCRWSPPPGPMFISSLG